MRNLNSYKILLIGCMFILSCHQRQIKVAKIDDSELRLSGNIQLSPFVDSLFRVFLLKAACPNCMFQIYFDKKDNEEYRITLTATGKNKNYLDNNCPVNYFLFDDSIPVFIYTGLEDFVSVRKFSVKIPVTRKDSSHKSFSWSFVKTKDTSYVVEDDWNPFIKLTLRPALNFSPPNR